MLLDNSLTWLASIAIDQRIDCSNDRNRRKDAAAGGQRQVLDARLTIVGSRAGEDSLSFSVERELVSPAPPGPAGQAEHTREFLVSGRVPLSRLSAHPLVVGQVTSPSGKTITVQIARPAEGKSSEPAR